MKVHHITKGTGLILLCFALLHPTVASAVEEPDCSSMREWATSLSPNETFEPRKGFVANTLFENERVVPLFGKPLVEWEREDVSSIQRWLANCRKQALSEKNRDMGNALYAALKEVKKAYRGLRGIWNARRMVAQSIGNLNDLKPSPELPEILRIAQAALRGEKTDARVSALAPRWKGYGNQAAQLKNYREMLSEEEIKAWIDKLENKRVATVASAEKRNAAHAALLAQIAAVPISPRGLSQLNGIAYRADPGAMPRKEQDSFNRAIQNKRRQIQMVIASQKAKVEHDMTSLPAPARQQAAAVLQGSTADNASVRGLHPGAPYKEIKMAAEQLWGYGEALTIGGAQDKQLSTKRREFNRLKREERRDGGLLNLRTRKGVVGELSYVEHFTGPMSTADLRTDLVKRFGKPDKENKQNDGYLSMTWHAGGHYLRVNAGNRVTQDRQFMGLQSSMEITLWTQDFADYLADADRRCERLRDKPVSELSTNDKQAVMMSCLTP